MDHARASAVRDAERAPDVALAECGEKRPLAQVPRQAIPRSDRLVDDVPDRDAPAIALDHRLDVRLEQMLDLAGRQTMDPFGQEVVPDECMPAHPELVPFGELHETIGAGELDGVGARAQRVHLELEFAGEGGAIARVGRRVLGTIRGIEFVYGERGAEFEALGARESGERW